MKKGDLEVSLHTDRKDDDGEAGKDEEKEKEKEKQEEEEEIYPLSLVLKPKATDKTRHNLTATVAPIPKTPSTTTPTKATKKVSKKYRLDKFDAFSKARRPLLWRDDSDSDYHHLPNTSSISSKKKTSAFEKMPFGRVSPYSSLSSSSTCSVRQVLLRVTLVTIVALLMLAVILGAFFGTDDGNNGDKGDDPINDNATTKMTTATMITTLATDRTEATTPPQATASASTVLEEIREIFKTFHALTHGKDATNALKKKNIKADSSLITAAITTARSLTTVTLTNVSASNVSIAFNETHSPQTEFPRHSGCPANLCLFVFPPLTLVGFLSGIPICIYCVFSGFSICCNSRCCKGSGNEKGSYYDSVGGGSSGGGFQADDMSFSKFCKRMWSGGRKKDHRYAFLYFGTIWAVIFGGLSLTICVVICGL